MLDLKSFEVWFLTGSQHLYGEDTLRQVDTHARQIAETLNLSPHIPVQIRHQPVLTTASAMQDQIEKANTDKRCIGLVLWMHTFSPAKMWIAALQRLRKPFLHLHTQFNRELPWSTIDMDFMNLNQSAHGDREFGFLASRLRLRRTVVVGFYEEARVQEQIGRWTRVAVAWNDSQQLKVARFGDNMRNVAVTEGDKVEAQIRFGYSVNGYGLGDLVEQVNAVEPNAVAELLDQYDGQYTVANSLQKGGAQRASLEDAARIELGLRRFLNNGGFGAWTDTFEDLHGLSQLPGIAAQRLMADGYGFGPEGDWKTAALVRSMKVMSSGLGGGTSLMEDYTYHLAEGAQVLGSHMLEICPSIASDKPSVQIHPLSIGGKADPVRLVFDTRTGPAVVASIIDMGNRFRMIVNKVNVVPSPEPLPNLPVARALWEPEPSFEVAATTWLLAGGAHHTGFSQSLTTTDLQMFADMAGIECLLIDDNTSVRSFENELRWNDAAY